jgi:3-oxoacyl-[acyl-carrier-protein] synthase II
MGSRRVVITGMGVVSCIGTGLDEYTESLRQGKCGHRAISAFDTSGFPFKNACEVIGFEPERWIHTLDPQTLGRSSQFSVAASQMAIEDAGIATAELSGTNCAVLVGTTDGESVPLEQLTRQWVEEGLDHLDAELIEKVPADNLSARVAQEFNLSGEALTISTACSAGNYAIGTALDMIKAGETDVVLCGGSDAVCRKTFAGFYRLGTLAPEYPQPFDKNRQGILTGEGCGMLLVESLNRALQRGATIYAEILGYALNCDASHMVAPDQSSIAQCMRLAHQNAAIRASDVDYICAHGTGTSANDYTEAMSIREVFGDQPPPTSSIKSMLGHSMGAAGALATIACSVAIQQNFIPPTVNYTAVDPDCDLDCVPNVSRQATLNIVQNNAFAFGGNNAILILGRYS